MRGMPDRLWVDFLLCLGYLGRTSQLRSACEGAKGVSFLLSDPVPAAHVPNRSCRLSWFKHELCIPLCSSSTSVSRILEMAFLSINLSLLQQIFPTPELNWGLLHCRRILYQLQRPAEALVSLVLGLAKKSVWVFLYKLKLLGSSNIINVWYSLKFLILAIALFIFRISVWLSFKGSSSLVIIIFSSIFSTILTIV